MESIIITLLASIAMAFVWVEILHVPYRFHQKLNFKPFNCAVCLSGWFALFLTGLHWYAIPMMCFAMIGQIFLAGLIRKL